MKKRILFRADGNAQMGLGHVIRSLALADMLKTDFECSFLIRNPLPYLKFEILKVCQQCVELPNPNDDLQEAQWLLNNTIHNEDIIVLDGYHFTTNYQIILKDTGAKVVCIDDIHSYHFVADLVINHAPGLASDVYSGELYTHYCLGLDYALLRPPFLKAAQQERSIENIDSAFICFGGSDFNNITLKSLKALTRQEWIKKVHVVLGGANENKDQIETFSNDQKAHEINIHQNLSAEEMVFVMQQCQLAILPSSSILYEAISVKMMVISGYFVDNQIGVYHGFKQLGLIHGVGDFNTFEAYDEAFEEIRNLHFDDILNRQQRNLDGQSAKNFIQLFNQLPSLNEPSLTHRRAKKEDMSLYFDWANEKLVREYSINQASIPIEDHSQWFYNRLNKQSSILYVFFLGRDPIGQVRFELENERAIINYSLDHQMRGKGLGKKMLTYAIDVLKKEAPINVHEIWGVVKTNNIPSKKIFEKLDFKLEKKKLIQGAECLVFSLKNIS